MRVCVCVYARARVCVFICVYQLQPTTGRAKDSDLFQPRPADRLLMRSLPPNSIRAAVDHHGQGAGGEGAIILPHRRSDVRNVLHVRNDVIHVVPT